MVSQERLRELFDYCPERGRLIRKHDTRQHKAGNDAGFSVTEFGYRVIQIGGKRYSERRCIWAWHYGDSIPSMVGTKNKLVDDHRIENLFVKSI